jgi:hypothetical protein
MVIVMWLQVSVFGKRRTSSADPTGKTEAQMRRRYGRKRVLALNSSVSRYGSWGTSCEHGNETTRSHVSSELPDKMSDFYFLKRHSTDIIDYSRTKLRREKFRRRITIRIFDTR